MEFKILLRGKETVENMNTVVRVLFYHGEHRAKETVENAKTLVRDFTCRKY